VPRSRKRRVLVAFLGTWLVLDVQDLAEMGIRPQ